MVDTPELAGDTIAWITREPRSWLGGRYLSVNWDMEELLQNKDAIGNNLTLKTRMIVDDISDSGREVGLGGKWELNKER